MQRIPIFGPLVDEDWHDGEPVVWLKEHLFCCEQPCRVTAKRRGIIDRRTEVAGRARSILEAKGVIASVPFQALMAQTDAVSIRCGNLCARRRLATFRR